MKAVEQRIEDAVVVNGKIHGRELHMIGIQRILIAVRLVLQSDDLFRNDRFCSLAVLVDACNGKFHPLGNVGTVVTDSLEILGDHQ